MKQYLVYAIWFLLAIAQITQQANYKYGSKKVRSHSLFESGELEKLEKSFKGSGDNENEDEASFLEMKRGKHHKRREEPAKKEEGSKKDESAKKEEAAKKTPAPPVYDPDLVLQKDEVLSVELSDWLKISSPEFKNPKKFPPMSTPQGKTLAIKIDEAYYRKNKSFKEGDKNGPPSNLYFWFRMSNRNLYYSLNKSDLNVLGNIILKDVQDIIPMKAFDDEPTCFVLVDNLESKWKLCAENMQVKAKWVCAFKKLLKQEDKTCEKTALADAEVTVLTKKATQPIILIPLPQRFCNEKWDYQRNGDDWECECKESKEQSPIDLPLKENAKESPVKPVFQYEEVQAKDTRANENGVVKPDTFLKFILENGTLKIKNKFFGKIITLDGSVYAAEEIVFHTPSEHKINGKQYDMEMQIIHTGQTKGDIAKQVILSFVFEKKPGKYNKFLDDLDFFNLPNPMAPVRDIVNNLYLPKILYSSDNEDLPVMKPFAFYTYQGSLTAPPCSERTIHYVAAKPIPVGNVVIQLFQEATRIPDMMDANGNVIVSTSLSVNNRKVQPLNGRTVYYFNYVEVISPEIADKPPAKSEGHYEKVNKKITEYFYVNNDKPSGLPGAFVVSETEAKGN